MTAKPASPAVHVVKKEEKEARLREFVQRRIAGRGALPSLGVIARSFDSPAIKALAAEAGSLDVMIDAIVLKPSDAADAEAFTAPLAGRVRCRLASDPRLLDAHEQIILDDTAIWIGDCMRRDPEKRDAFECYAEDAAEVVAWARACFARLWRVAEPLSVAGRRPADEPATAAVAPVLPGPGDAATDGEVEAGTCH
ncbi:MAG: hypothetical protein AB1749_11315 [Pseudomonadota bacterium]